jgi:hypothetical protein
MNRLRARWGLVALALVALAGGCSTPKPSAPATDQPSPSAPATIGPSAAPSASMSATTEAPRVKCNPQTAANGAPDPSVHPMACEAAVAAAQAAVGPDPSIDYIEFEYGHGCPPNVYCITEPPHIGYVVYHMKCESHRADVVVNVTSDEEGKVTVSDSRVLASPSPGCAL